MTAIGIVGMTSSFGPTVIRTIPRTCPRKVRLSKAVGESRARDVAAQVYAVKEASGRFYVNEFRQIFAPIGSDLPVRYRYVRLLDIEAGWFPMSV